VGTTTYNYYFRKRLGVRLGQPLARPSQLQREPEVTMLPAHNSEVIDGERVGR
jgi:hypothetical protein